LIIARGHNNKESGGGGQATVACWHHLSLTFYP
jgi:hypothetical protein